MSKEEKMAEIRSNFTERSQEYDAWIRKIVPRYDEMLDALISCIPFKKDTSFRAIDIGCGTGAVSKRLLDAFPRAELTCLDMTEKMMDLVKERLKGRRNVRFVLSDIYDFEFDGPYDAVISSLALHHIITDEDKKLVYRKILGALAPGGSFFNADLVIGSDAAMQELNMSRWKEFMYRGLARDYVDEVQVPRHYREDSPSKLVDHLRWLEEAGFTGVDVAWKHLNFVVYGGRRPLLPP